MSDVEVGSEQFSDEDRRVLGLALPGCRQRPVRQSLSAGVGPPGEPPLPDEHVSIRTVFGGLWLASRPSIPARLGARARFGRRSALGTGRQRIHAPAASQRHLSHRTRGRSLKTRRTPDISPAAARLSSSPGIRAGRAGTGAATFDHSPSSASFFRRPIRTTRHRCGPRTSSRRRTSAAPERHRSTTPSCETRPTSRCFGAVRPGHC